MIWQCRQCAYTLRTKKLDHFVLFSTQQQQQQGSIGRMSILKSNVNDFKHLWRESILCNQFYKWSNDHKLLCYMQSVQFLRHNLQSMSVQKNGPNCRHKSYKFSLCKRLVISKSSSILRDLHRVILMSKEPHNLLAASENRI